MAKPKDLDTWGRATARKRYAEGGGTPGDMEAEDRPKAIDELIDELARSHARKLQEEG